VKHRVLVIDDEEDSRDAVSRRLKADGFEVEEAASPAEAVAKINAASPAYEVIVTDMVMESPDSGVQTLIAALQRDIFCEVIVLTAYGNVGNAVDSMRRGAFDYLQKNDPHQDVYEQLVERVHSAFQRRRSSTEAVRRLTRTLQETED